MCLYLKCRPAGRLALFLTQLAGVNLLYASIEIEPSDYSYIKLPWLSVYSAMHENIMFNQSDHRAVCCSNTACQDDRQCEMESDDTRKSRGLVEMTLKHGTSHSAPVKCLKKAFSTSSQLAGEWLTPPHTHYSLSYLPHLYTVMASVHVTSLFCYCTVEQVM